MKTPTMPVWLRHIMGMAALVPTIIAGLPTAEAQVRSAQAVPAAQKTRIVDAIEEALIQQENLVYATYDERELALDLYRPKASKVALPGIVCIHGGGWAKGNRKGHRNLAKAIAAKGYVAVTISYRLSGEAPFPAAIHDCKAAVRWMRANAGRYQINPEAIGAIGLSAGGHLTALLATSGGVASLEGNGGYADSSSAIQAAVPMGAQTDFLSDRTRDISAAQDRGAIWRQFLGGSQAERPQTYQLASPLFHLDKSDPPQRFITGANDDPSTRAERFRAKMKQLEIAESLRVIPNAPHPFLGRQEWFDEAVESAVTHFDTHLKGGKE